ncbi:hypothetical protein D3C87_299210 [compost metagenome]
MDINEIKDHMQKGLANGYRENLLLLSAYNDFVDQIQEYLLTVNVAQQLLKWNRQNGYKIRIEYPVYHFYNNAFIASDWRGTDIFNMEIIQRKLDHAPTTKFHQKIDIVITQEQFGGNASINERTISGIELKGINKSQEDIFADARRMSEAMIRTDGISSNSIKFCFCAFLRRFDKAEEMVTKRYIEQKKTEEMERWGKVCIQFAFDYPTLDFSFQQFDIQNTPLEEIADIHKWLDSDYSEVVKDTGLVVGYILTIIRK